MLYFHFHSILGHFTSLLSFFLDLVFMQYCILCLPHVSVVVDSQFYFFVVRYNAGCYFNYPKFLRLALCASMWLIFEKVPWVLRRKYILWYLGGIFCRCLLGPFDLWCHLTPGFLYLVFDPDHLLIGESRVLKSPSLYWGQPVILDALWNAMAMCLVDIYEDCNILLLDLFSLMNIKCPYFVISCSLKSVLSDIRSYSCLFLHSVFSKCPFPLFYPKVMFVIDGK